MTDILNLPDWKAIATRQEGSEFVIEAEYAVQPKACQKCGVLDRLYRHGVKATGYRDSPWMEVYARYEQCEAMASMLQVTAAKMMHDLRITEQDVLERCYQGLRMQGQPFSKQEAIWNLTDNVPRNLFNCIDFSSNL